MDAITGLHQQLKTALLHVLPFPARPSISPVLAQGLPSASAMLSVGPQLRKSQGPCCLCTCYLVAKLKKYKHSDKDVPEKLITVPAMVTREEGMVLRDQKSNWRVRGSFPEEGDFKLSPEGGVGASQVERCCHLLAVHHQTGFRAVYKSGPGPCHGPNWRKGMEI